MFLVCYLCSICNEGCVVFKIKKYVVNLLCFSLFCIKCSDLLFIECLRDVCSVCVFFLVVWDVCSVCSGCMGCV